MDGSQGNRSLASLDFMKIPSLQINCNEGIFLIDGEKTVLPKNGMNQSVRSPHGRTEPPQAHKTLD